MKKTIIIDVISYLYALLFLYTGIFKVLDQESLKQTLYKSPLLHQFVPVVAVVIPFLELAIAVALLLPFFRPAPLPRRWGLCAGTALMAVFTLYIGYMLRVENGHLPCSCGGIIQVMNWHQHLYFNGTFTLLGLLAYWLNNRYNKSPEGKPAFS